MIQKQFHIQPELQNFGVKAEWTPVGILRNGVGKQFGHNLERQHFEIPQTPCSDQVKLSKMLMWLKFRTLEYLCFVFTTPSLLRGRWLTALKQFLPGREYGRPD